MDLMIPIIFIIVLFLMFSICGWCCKKHRQGVVFGQAGTPVVVTTTGQHINSSPVVIPPYPIEPQHPLPQQHPPAPGFAPMGHYQPPAPGFYYPPGVGAQMGDAYAGVYPPQVPAGYPGAGAPYPSHAPPPSYNEAVTQPAPSQPPTNEAYSKQAPYNPNY